MRIWATAFSLFLVAAVLAAPRTYEVKWIGELRKVMMEGDDRPLIDLQSLKSTQHLYAIGPVEGLNGEITVFDGDPAIGLIKNGQPTVEKTFNVKAALLVWAKVERWNQVAVPDTVKTIADLNTFVGEAARKAGIDMSAPFPFRVNAHTHEVAMHVVNRQGREAKGHEAHDQIAVKVPLQHSNVELLGFWSDKHQGVFVHHSSNIHVHARTADGKLSGHVDELKIGSGQLWLPAVR